VAQAVTWLLDRGQSVEPVIQPLTLRDRDGQAILLNSSKFTCPFWLVNDNERSALSCCDTPLMR
jgi:hypothetical protein